MQFMILVLFLLAGLLVGGAWSAYQQDSKFLTVVAALLAVITVVAAIAWMVGGFSK
ncbi:hypothetical protein GWO53_05820 [Corynebacterium macginleyi]|uniref:Uncharacterized protein n=1 Tax=Corynebacterium macginleyi TaxID=38290 RepID=A0ABS1Y5K5_9CORY|nr:hypothetical protein [Corynebacterium macginleyi]MBK4137649.1 hypothetical protein [Corynebacterium macginleyi]MBK4139988.1 hypothetical protein [Corynebacterium macginleyi]MBK4141731.1 hypothetical protein [Corynebacterium macginleyi]MBK4143937.1 hypothetical protein [Corynebacterium macginleyi]MBK4146043.1 hypothetical protein [Corynebacterium macginleyi]